jgi:Tol biopolymer transport system component
MKTNRFLIMFFPVVSVMIFVCTGAYAAEGKNTCGIHIINADGNDAVQLTSGKEWDPAWSPDGKRIAYCLSGAIYVMNTDGSSKVKLTDSGTGPLWSPDANQIVYSRIQYPKTYEIYIINADGTKRIRISAEGAYPRWSPDGKKIAYCGKRIGISLIKSDGTGDKLLTYDYGTAPNWSPDGKRIAYHRYLSPGVKEVIAINANGSGEVKLAASGRFPVWSPDGKRIAFKAGGRINVVNADGTKLIRLPIKEVSSFAWSPDSKSIVCYHYKPPSTNEIYIISADGKNKSKLTGVGRHPCWSPDGKRIVFAGVCN